MRVYMEETMNPAARHITRSEDLVTTYEETRAGFIEMALEKNRRATPFVAEARALQHSIRDIEQPEDLLDMPAIRNGLIAASGISDKAASHMGEAGCTLAVQEFIRNFLVPAGGHFREELIFRFLLTRGDSLGGKMRNIVGGMAQRKICLSLISTLRLRGMDFFALPDAAPQGGSIRWISSRDVEDDLGIENSKGISYTNSEGAPRTVCFNLTVPIVRNNVDIILLNKPHTDDMKEIILVPGNYVALGELKGGIDPAGADEHWKTAKMALDRIYEAFKKNRLMPHLFFIGASIASKMAAEIYGHLQSEYLSCAANLTKPDHIAALIDWLLGL